jgi:acyl-coenzyme A thioesterase PaaI-like protein
VSTTPDEAPPSDRSSFDLDVTLDQPTAERSIAISPLTDAVRDPSGAAGLGYLVTLADACASMPALCGVAPDWTVTADLMLHEFAPLVHGPAVIDCHLTRAGARFASVRVEMYDGEGLRDPAEVADPITLRRVATGTVNFARVSSATSDISHLMDPLREVGTRRRWTTPEGPPTEPIASYCGIAVVDAPSGVVEVAIAPHVRNNRGQLSGGVLGVVFQSAAEAAHPGFSGSDMVIHYLSGARHGPVRTRALVVRATDDHVVTRIDAYDAGADDQLVAQATVTLQRYAR